MWFCKRLVVGGFREVSRRFCCAAATESSVVVENRGPVRLIGINRPHCRNAVNQSTALTLYQTFQDFDSDQSAHVAVLHGYGGTFCAGYDLKELASKGNSLKVKEDIDSGPSPLGPAHLVLSKPVVAAVSGHAVAGGLELALLCDLRVVEEDAVMGVFCRRFGVPLLDGGTVRLPALIGLSRALDLILTGRPVRSEEALNIGLANRVVPNGQALHEAISLAEQLSAFPQECLRADRESAIRQANTLKGPLWEEFVRGKGVVASESVKGATLFSQGKGRHGSFKN